MLAASAAAQPAQLVKDVASEQLPAVSFPADYFYFVEMGGRLYFAANDDIHGFELWTSDGSETGTEMVADLCPGICHSRPAWLTVSGNRIFFAAHDGV
ncbi:MAG TPA: ELWxxDGT repeat protein, partial [Thermoanaerobaculia bacterium]|nr:ELWxxDGT repeat protein [Thermoanaerobaculia bacterium]